jgi:uncharacterized protein (DUF934 family)
MHIIKNKAIIEDGWHFVSPETPQSGLPEGDLIVPLALWQQCKNSLTGKLGVALSSSQAIEGIVDDLDKLALIALEFPAFKDGRHYSSARLLRERYGFTGEIRAYGEVNRDQLYYMSRVGFDAFQFKPGTDLEIALSAFKDFSVNYQASCDQPLPLYRRR